MARTATKKDEKGKVHLLVEKFQCPGCMLGSDTECGSFKLNDALGAGASCKPHVAGTVFMLGGRVYLGLPKGFNKAGPLVDRDAFYEGAKNNIRLWTFGTHPEWNNCNVAVWAMDGVDDYAGFLLVRTMLPRIGLNFIDIIEGGERAKLCPNALDVATFIDEID